VTLSASLRQAQAVKQSRFACRIGVGMGLPGYLHRHCEKRSDEAIHLAVGGGMDCFAEPVIGRAFARPVGSQ
jgi:hypothetical protein